MATRKLVLHVGATGNMGGRIARTLATKEEVSLRVLVRPEAGDKAEQIKHLESLGAEVVEGDLTDSQSLERACAGVDTVLSSVNGDHDIALTGQINLLHAAKAMGVSVFMPSDYSFDYHKIAVGDNYNYDARIAVAQAVRQSGMGYTSIMCGAFMEVFFAPYFHIFDFEKGAAEYWGDADVQFDLTSMDDAARYTAEAVVDPHAVNTDFQVAGEVTSINKIAAVYEEVAGKPLRLTRKGTIENLKTWIEAEKVKNPDPFVPGPFPNPYMFGQYQWGMLSGKGKLDHLVNDRYPHIQPRSIRQYLQEVLAR